MRHEEPRDHTSRRQPRGEPRETYHTTGRRNPLRKRGERTRKRSAEKVRATTARSCP